MKTDTPSEIPCAWVRPLLTDPWHVVRGLTPLQAAGDPVFTLCERQLDATHTTDHPVSPQKVCRLCHDRLLLYRPS